MKLYLEVDIEEFTRLSKLLRSIDNAEAQWAADFLSQKLAQSVTTDMETVVEIGRPLAAMVKQQDQERRQKRQEEAKERNEAISGLVQDAQRYQATYPWKVSAVDRATQSLLRKQFKTEAEAREYAETLEPTHDNIELKQYEISSEES